MQHTKPTQEERVIRYMEENGSITQMQALLDIGVMRLASRISALRRKGYVIGSKMVAVKNRYNEPCYVKEYFLIAGEALDEEHFTA